MPSSLEDVREEKAPITAISEEQRDEFLALFTDDVLSKLTGAFFDVCRFEKWTKRDLSSISGINETAIGHILAGRRKNLTIETIALLARAMRMRPELVLHDIRPIDNEQTSKKTLSLLNLCIDEALAQPKVMPRASALDAALPSVASEGQQKSPARAEQAAYMPTTSYGNTRQ